MSLRKYQIDEEVDVCYKGSDAENARIIGFNNTTGKYHVLFLASKQYRWIPRSWIIGNTNELLKERQAFLKEQELMVDELDLLHTDEPQNRRG